MKYHFMIFSLLFCVFFFLYLCRIFSRRIRPDTHSCDPTPLIQTCPSLQVLFTTQLSITAIEERITLVNKAYIINLKYQFNNINSEVARSWEFNKE